MSKYVTLAEAATYLGVSKATLRNWDRAGKLRAVRDPMNRYRVYPLADLQLIQSRLPLGDEDVSVSETRSLDARSMRSLISRLHNIIRDKDSQSNIIERFDELTKLLFLKISTEQDAPDLIDRQPQEADGTYAVRIRDAYSVIVPYANTRVARKLGDDAVKAWKLFADANASEAAAIIDIETALAIGGA
jgi:type I restriction enzyme M protein